MSITKKGFIWEIINSLWIIFAFCGMTFISFFYIGTKSKTFKWKVMGVLYFLANIVSILLAALVPFSGIIDTILCLIWGIALFAGPINVFLVRKEYLIRREYILSNGLEEEDLNKIKSEVEKQYKGKDYIDVNNQNTYIENNNNDDYSTMGSYKSNDEDLVYSNINSSEKEKDYYDSSLVKNNEEILDNSKYVSYSYKNTKDLININTSTIEELLKLPGMDEELAEKSISLREMLGGFNSVQEFIEMMHISLNYSNDILEKATVGDRRIKR